MVPARTMKPTTIRLPDDCQEYVDREHALTGVPKVRIIADCIRKAAGIGKPKRKKHV